LRSSLSQVTNLLLPSRGARLSSTLAIHLLQTGLSFAQAIECALVLGDRFVRVSAGRGLRFLHLICSLVQLPAQFLHLCIAPFPRKTLEFARSASRLFN